MEAAAGFEPAIKDLQSSALPLGYAAITFIKRKNIIKADAKPVNRRFYMTQK
jgi:hypothetical protein